jgi:ferredoxin-nitrate reductase
MDKQLNSNSRDSIKDIWGKRTSYYQEWPIRVDQHVIEEPDEWIQSACVLCSNGCGLDIGVKDGRIVGVRGRAEDRINFGRLGPKGLNGWVANNSPDRLTKPLIRRNGQLEEATWDEAMTLMTLKTKDIIQKHGSSAIGVYTSGQLFLEEYYTLAVINKAGLGTPHTDGNTRLCTATADAALKISFGTDGQPSSYTDIDTTDCLLLVGHNVASQQTVLWMRILDRLAGANPPKIVVIDPRNTFTTEKADVHLRLKPGTNVAVLNGLIHLLIKNGNIDEQYIQKHTVGFKALKKQVEKWTPELVEKVSSVSANKLIEAAKIIGNAPTLLSTALQGVYQSMQATAAALQINNIQLIRGMIGKPGCGVYQMNGQPTSQNTRECGADGDYAGFRNWQNKEHMKELAAIWNVSPSKLPHWQPATHAMQIWRYAEQGSIKMMWIQATNPAVSLPGLARIRKILQKEDLFVVVQDAFLTETAKYANIVLPAAMWGEKTGCFTNVDRTVHISHKAVEPPGDAKSDLDIFLDFARRMEFKDKDGGPLIKWTTPEETFEEWKRCSKGRPCDYSGMSYKKLTGGAGIQWPCNEKYPDGKERLYTDGIFNTAYATCETFGYDIITGAERKKTQYKANDPKGKAVLVAADYQPPHEEPDDTYTLWLTTGRLVYHFHTRTKTGRSKELNDAAPEVFVEISPEDASSFDIEDGDMIKIESRRGSVEAAARICDIIPGTIFIPFHYGYWDEENSDHERAANELTLPVWDPISKQPHLKYAAVSLKKVTGKTTVVGDIVETVKEKLNL